MNKKHPSYDPEPTTKWTLWQICSVIGRVVLLWMALSTTNSSAAVGDQNWDDRFAPTGVGGSVLAVAVSGTNLYVGGNFGGAFDVPAAGIVKWNGRSWSALGAGLANSPGGALVVTSIALNGTDVYVAGEFALAGGVTVNNIARWDGDSWSALGSGVTNASGSRTRIYALKAIGGDLYVGGAFTSAGGVNATNIAKWDGTSWSALGTGVTRRDNSYVLAMAVSGSDLYVGGRFMTAGGVSATNVAKWDGGSWSALGPGVGVAAGFQNDYDRVTGLAVIGNKVYAGGYFTTIGGTGQSPGVLMTRGIAQWDGSAWSALGNGVTGQVEAVAVIGDDLYVGGLSSDIVKWDGTGWSTLGIGLGPNGGTHVYALTVSGSDLYVGGGFKSAGGLVANNIAKWDGSSWSSTFGRALDSTVYAMAAAEQNVYVAGDFQAAGDLPVNRVARWDGANWSSLGSGINSRVLALGTDGTNVYAGGIFTMAGGLNISNVAHWDGNNWSALGTGLAKAPGGGIFVNAIAVSGTDVYFGGEFGVAGGVTVNNIARWDGANWFALGTGLSPQGGAVSCITTNGTDIYVGGGFTAAGGVAIPNHIARWDGKNWSALGIAADILPGGVEAIAVIGSDVYVAGGFVRIGALSARNIAKWNGTKWSALGAGSRSGVSALTVIGRTLYASGSFSAADGSRIDGIAKWDGNNWSDIGSGGVLANAMVASGSELYVGGNFTKAGGKPSRYFAIWHAPRPQASVTILPGGDRFIIWNSEPGRFYQILATTDLTEPFTPLSGIIPSGGITTSYVDSSAPGQRRFYEIVELQ